MRDPHEQTRVTQGQDPCAELDRHQDSSALYEIILWAVMWIVL